MSNPIPEPLLSVSACDQMSQSACELLAVGSSQFYQLQAVIPLWGYGKINTSGWPSPGSNFNPINTGTGDGTCNMANWGALTWPIVYNKCTETWTDGSGTVTRISTFNQFYDTYFLPVVTSGANPYFSYPNNTVNYTFTSVTATTLTLAYTDGHLIVGVYTAVLSEDMFGNTGPFNPNDATYGWANLTAQANALLTTLAGLITPSIFSSAKNKTKTIYPISASPGYLIQDSDTALATASFAPVVAAFVSQYNITCAAANGLAVMVSGGLGGWAPYCIFPMGHMIADNPVFSAYPPTAGWGNPNIGGVLCSQGLWKLATTDHGTIYGQKLNIDATTGAVTLAASAIAPAAFTNPNQVSANGTLTADPVIAFKKVLQFNPTDVNNNLGSPYGMLGFNSAPI